MDNLHILLALTTIFAGALAGGRLAAMLHVPRVTGYLLTGLLFGPSCAHLLGFTPLISSAAITELRPLSQLALALIMMNVGGQFQLEQLRRWRGRIFALSAVESGTTFVLVAGGCALTNLVWLHQAIAPFSVGATSLLMGLLTGIIAIATAPAATMMVIREYSAEGTTTATLLALVGLNNIISVVLFLLVQHFLFNSGGSLLWGLGGPLFVGGGIAFLVAIWSQRLDLGSEFKCLVLGALFAITVMCQLSAVNVLLTHLVFGIILANSSPRWHKIYAAIKQVDYPLYVLFFVIAGASLHLETLAHIGSLGVVYVLMRCAGKWYGARWGARLAHFSRREQRYLGQALMAQAGVAIGLAATCAQMWPVGGKLLETVILGAVVVFELFGPVAVRNALVASGEVPILSLLRKRAPQGAVEGLHDVVSHFRAALGIPHGHRIKDAGDILVEHIMRKNVETIRNDTPFNELLRFIAHSRYDRFPVVDKNGAFVGIIDYTEIRNLLFEPALANLIVAGDLLIANPQTLAPRQSLREAMETLNRHRHISYFPVVDPARPEQLLGVISQNDLLSTFQSFDNNS